MSRGAGRTASKDYVQCCVCCYSVGLGVKKIGKVTNINHAMVRKILIKQGVYKGNTGRKPNPWINGKVATKRDADIRAELRKEFEEEQRGFRCGDEATHWNNHIVASREIGRIRALKTYYHDKEHNPFEMVKRRLKHRLWKFTTANGTARAGRTMELVGCEQDELIRHIESQFTKGMSWANRSMWHIDHIVPCSSFDMSNEDEQRRCFHYTNLQPLWAADNLKKSDSIRPHQQRLMV